MNEPFVAPVNSGFVSASGIDADAKAILDQRAKELARPAADGNEFFGDEMLTFGLARERYAVSSEYVFSVFQLEDITRLPGVAPPLYGLARWRGDVLTVLDLRSTLGVSSQSLDDLKRVIVVGDRRPSFGILVDRVDSIVRLAQEDVLPLGSGGKTYQYLLGVTSDALQVIDIEKLLRLQADSI